MIALIIDPASGLSDSLDIFIPPVLAFAPVDWYVSWQEFPPPGSGQPYKRNFGPYPGPALSMVSIPLVVPVEYIIREVSVRNPGQDPVEVFIQFSNGPISVILFNCLLGAGHKLKYNAAPGQNMGWQIFDGAGNLVSG